MKPQRISDTMDDGVEVMRLFYITGDTHGDFRRIESFCERVNPSPEDVLIILGDAGINYYGGWRDRNQKKLLAKLPLTLFSIHGNHEQRPATIPSYHTEIWNGGEVYVEDEFPNLLFAVDGSYFSFDGVRTFVIGGAYSVDKHYRLANNWGWWPDEQPDEAIKRRVEQQLDAHGWRADVVLTHTCPLRYEPTEVFLSCIDQSGVDKSTEEWLDSIEDSLQYKQWYCGHYHTEKVIDKLKFMFESIRAFPTEADLRE